jgi:citrate lyase beta subunit
VLDAAATQGGAFSLDGKMVDGPVIAKAKRIASSAG